MKYLDNDYEMMYYIKENDSDIPLEMMVGKYSYLVEHIIYKIYESSPNYVELDDLRQEAMIGLIDAIHKYTYKYDNKISTYFYSCIKFRVLNYVRNEQTLKKRINYNTISLDSENDYDIAQIKKNLEKSNVDVSNVIENEYEYFSIHNKLTANESLLFDLKLNNFPKEEIMKLLEINLKKYNNRLYNLRKKLN